MRGVRGCFVCGQDHRANDRHSSEEVNMAVKKLKAKTRKALISIEDLAFIASQLGDGPQENEGEVFLAQWAREDEETETSDLALVPTYHLQDVKQPF